MSDQRNPLQSFDTARQSDIDHPLPLPPCTLRAIEKTESCSSDWAGVGPPSFSPLSYTPALTNYRIQDRFATCFLFSIAMHCAAPVDALLPERCPFRTRSFVTLKLTWQSWRGMHRGEILTEPISPFSAAMPAVAVWFTSPMLVPRVVTCASTVIILIQRRYLQCVMAQVIRINDYLLHTQTAY